MYVAVLFFRKTCFLKIDPELHAQCTHTCHCVVSTAIGLLMENLSDNLVILDDEEDSTCKTLVKYDESVLIIGCKLP